MRTHLLIGMSLSFVAIAVPLGSADVTVCTDAGGCVAVPTLGANGCVDARESNITAEVIVGGPSGPALFAGNGWRC